MSLLNKKDKSMQKKRLAIIGANESICILIEKAKSLGYETHVFAWKCGDPGERIADFFYPIDISEKDRILEICKKIDVCGVCSITSDYAAPIVAYISRHLALPSNPEITDLISRNKYEMRKAFKHFGGIYSPKFCEVGEYYDIDTVMKTFNMPVIIKPTDRWSSKGITRVDKVDDLPKAIEYAIKESIEKKAIIEDFIEGPEFSAECIVKNGRVYILAFTEKITTGYPHYIEKGHIQPAKIPFNKDKYIRRIISKAVKSLSIKNSAAHVEFRIMNNGKIGFMEIGARMGGDCIGTDLTPNSTGLDYVKMVIDVACGNKLDFSKKKIKEKITVKFIIDRDDYEDFKTIDSNRIIKKSDFDLNFTKEVIDSSTRHGFYIYRG